MSDLHLNVISKKETYWSLQKRNKLFLNALQKQYDFAHYEMPTKIDYRSQKLKDEINSLYKESDVVLYISSKSLFFQRLYPKPTIFLGHAWLDHYGGLNLYFRRKSYNQQDMLTFASRPCIEKYKVIFKKGIEANLLPYFVDEINFSYVPNEKREDFLKRYGIPEQKKIILYTGRFNSQKRTKELVNCYYDIKKEYSNCCLVLVGTFVDEYFPGFKRQNRDYKKEVLDLIKERDIQDVFFINPVNEFELRKFYFFSDIFINLTTSFEEDFGVSQIEAQSFGLPVVCTEWGGLKDTVKDGYTGYKISTTLLDNSAVEINFEDIPSKVVSLLDDEDRYLEFSIHAKHYVKQYYSEDTFLNNIKGLIEKASTQKAVFNEDSSTFEFTESVWPYYEKIISRKSYDTMYSDYPNLFKLLYSVYVE